MFCIESKERKMLSKNLNKSRSQLVLTQFSLIIASTLLCSSQAHAFKADRPYSRANIPVKYRINPARMPFGIAIVKEAGAKWSNHPKFDFKFTYTGTSTAKHGRGYNNIYMDNGRMGRNTLGLTWFYYKSGYRSGFDMAFNGARRWERGQFLDTAIHEFGHALGLHHSRLRTAVMKPYVAKPYIDNIRPDDIAGAAYLYPRSADNPPDTNDADGPPPPSEPDAMPPAKPERRSPKGEITTLKPTFEWSAVDGATHYELSVDVIENGKQSRKLRISPLESTSYTHDAPLKSGQKFYWWVRAVNVVGNSGWGNETRFNIKKQQPSLASLITPLGESEEASPIFNWTTVENADSYELYIRKADSESPLHYEKEISTTRQLTSLNFEAGQSYYWWIRAKTGSHLGAWSKHGQFMIKDSATDGPASPDADDLVCENGICPENGGSNGDCRDNGTCPDNNSNSNNCSNKGRGLFSNGFLGRLTRRR
jgi:hypothetical protein